MAGIIFDQPDVLLPENELHPASLLRNRLFEM